MPLRDTARLMAIARIARCDVVESIYHAGSGHPGGSLSIVDMLTALYFDELRHDPGNPQDANRDRLVLSKGHAAPALYAALAAAGYFPKQELHSLRKLGAMLQGHPDRKGTPGVDMSTGALGIGISAACGMAKAAKIFGQGFRVYAILGDGELQEGEVWEALMFAAHYKLDNLVVLIDNNNLQIDGPIDEVLSPAPIADKLAAFGFETVTLDGHDFDQLFAGFDKARATKGKPTALLCKTIKGKGVSFMENNAAWHGAAPNEQQYLQAMQELRAAEVAS